MKRLNEAAFTIVETLLVMAVAGLMFLFIFNAIPALIRGGHNNQRKQDVATILSAVSEYQLRNSGSFPTAYATLTSNPNISGVGPLKLSFFDTANVNVNPVGLCGNAINISNVSPDKVVICNSELCNSTGATNTGAGYRDIVGVYEIETSGTGAVKCQQL